MASDTEPQGGDAFANLVDDDDVQAAVAKQGGEPEPAPEPAAAPEPKPAPAAEPELDRGASFRDAMQEMLEHVPEDKRGALQNRIEQAERWSSSVQEAKELKARFGDLNKLARSIQDEHRFSRGEELLKEKGAIAFLEAFSNGEYTSAQEPAAEPAEPEGLEGRLAKMEARLEQEAKARADAAEDERFMKQFAAEFDPAVKGVVGKWGLKGEAETKVGNAFADFAEALYVKDTSMNPDNPESVTVASTVAKAAEIIDIIQEARAAKRPAPPRPTVTPTETVDVDNDKLTDASEILESLDVGSDIDQILREQRGG